MDISQFVYPFTDDGHVGCFQFGAITDKAAENICMDIGFFSLG